MRIIKNVGMNILTAILQAQARRLRKSRKFIIVAVVGSIGKTSTKLAIATVLKTSLRVRTQEGNFNHPLTVPLVLFDQPLPHLLNIFGWLKIITSNELKLLGSYPYDVAVLELGTDGPGQLIQFAYLKPEFTVLTGIVAEHMEFFPSIDDVAREELSLAPHSDKLLVNIDDVSPGYLNDVDYISYGLDDKADYPITRTGETTAEGQELSLRFDQAVEPYVFSTPILGTQGAKILAAAGAIGELMGMGHDHIKKGLSAAQPFAGRLQVLKGKSGSTIIDDTYNASPASVKAALDVLYSFEVKKRIAILGAMNELGGHSQEAHEQVGSYCDPKKLDLVVTIGEQAKEFLAPAAIAAGCEVKSFDNPYQAGESVKPKLDRDTVVLAKGSQNGVFSEEAVKLLLADEADVTKLVRQNKQWLRKKKRQFPHS